MLRSARRISVRLRQQARSGRTARHRASLGGNSPPSHLAYSHAPWSPTAAASSRVSAGALSSLWRLRHCSPSLVRQFRWRRLPRAPLPRRRLRPPPLRPRPTTEVPRQATEVPRQATKAQGQAAPALYSPRWRRRLLRQMHPLARAKDRRPRLRSPRHQAPARLLRPLRPRALRPNDRRRHQPARLELFRSARS
jgi:hypothetical protein